MRHINRIYSLAAVAVLLGAGAGFGQETVSSAVLGNGGTQSAGAQFSLSGTLGQGLIGAAGDATYTSEGGFWYSTLEPDVEVSIPHVNGFYATQVNVPVLVTDTSAGDIVAAEVFIDYDGDVLAPVGTSIAGTLVENGWSVESNIEEGFQIDTYKIAMATDDDELVGSGTLIEVVFQVVDVRAPAYSDLVLQHVLFNDGDPNNTKIDGSLTVVGTDGSIISAVVSPASSAGVIPRETVLVTVDDIDEDRDVNAADSFVARASNGDQLETLLLSETGNSTGVFTGTIATAFSLASTSAASSGDGVLQAKADDALFFCYDDSLDAAGITLERCDSETAIGGTDATIRVTIVSQPGDTLRVRVTDADLNGDVNSAESAQVTASNPNTGESETIILNEDGIDSEVFFGIVGTAPGSAAGAGGDAGLNAQKGDVIAVSYLDDLTALGGSQVRADDDEVVDPFGDADGNGAVQAFDAAIILQHRLSTLTSGPGILAGLDSLSANLDLLAFDPAAGIINGFDASLVLQKRVGLIDRFPVQEDEADNHPQPETDNSTPKRIAGKRLLTLVPQGDYWSVRADQREGIVSGELVFLGAMERVQLGDELGEFIVAARAHGDKLHLVFAGSRPVSGPGELLRIYGVGPEGAALVRAEFNGGSVHAETEVSPSAHPAEYILHANAPNPFNPETSIRFTLPEESAVKLQVFDALGQRLRDLVSARLPAGTHQVRWDGRDATGVQVSSGVYFYRLRAGRFDDVRRMLLLK